MGTLIEDIKSQSDWIVKAFASDGYNLDYTIRSTMEVDRFFFNNMVDGVPKKNGRIPAIGFGPILFSIGSYLGETIIKNVDGTQWITDDDDPQGELKVALKLPDGKLIWPIQRVMKRYKNGSGDSIYPYIHIATKDFTKEVFDENFWQLENSVSKNTNRVNKPWWKFW